VSDMCRAATMASLDAAMRPAKPARAAVAGDLPAPLAKLVGSERLADLPWRKKAPGLALHEVAVPSGRLIFMKIAPGSAMPEHSHGGEELTLVLQGSYHDHGGTFRAGDIADLDEEFSHQPVTDGDEGCICVIAIEAPTRFKKVWAKLLQPIIGI
jgi:putative transcriptional regulator